MYLQISPVILWLLGWVIIHNYLTEIQVECTHCQTKHSQMSRCVRCMFDLHLLSRFFFSHRQKFRGFQLIIFKVQSHVYLNFSTFPSSSQLFFCGFYWRILSPNGYVMLQHGGRTQSPDSIYHIFPTAIYFVVCEGILFTMKEQWAQAQQQVLIF